MFPRISEVWDANTLKQTGADTKQMKWKKLTAVR